MAPDPRIGTLVGNRYAIESRLGAGGMGVVYAARDQHTGARCALKLLPPAAREHPDAARRFRREASALAAVTHPGIVRPWDAGETPDGAPYLAMELLEGEDLARRLDREPAPWPWPVARALFAQVASALAAAHAAGVLHRDLKPGNVFLSRAPDGAARARLLDFGLAKAFEDPSASTLTATGAMVGTPLYMAPEQALGQPVGPAADVYALAAILFELVAGAPPITGPTPMAVLARKLSEDAPPLRAFVRGGVPWGLEGVLARALDRRPEARFARVEEFAAAVDALGDALASDTHAAAAVPHALAHPAMAQPPSAPAFTAHPPGVGAHTPGFVASAPAHAAPPSGYAVTQATPAWPAHLASGPHFASALPSASGAGPQAPSTLSGVVGRPDGAARGAARRARVSMVVAGVVLGAVASGAGMYFATSARPAAESIPVAAAPAPPRLDPMPVPSAPPPVAPAPAPIAPAPVATAPVAPAPVAPAPVAPAPSRAARTSPRAAAPARSSAPAASPAAPAPATEPPAAAPGSPPPGGPPALGAAAQTMLRQMSARDYRACIATGRAAPPAPEVYGFMYTCALQSHDLAAATEACNRLRTRYPGHSLSPGCMDTIDRLRGAGY